MGLIAWILFGGLAGWMAGVIAGTKHGCCLNIVVGVLGASIGGFIMQSMLDNGFSIRFNLPSFAVAVMGAVLLLAVARLFAGKKR